MIAPRHYARVPGLVRRSTGDLSAESLDAQARGRAVLADVIPVGPQAPRLVSTGHGAIQELLFTIPTYAVGDIGGQPNPLEAVYQDLFRQLPKTIRLIVMTHESTAQIVDEWLTTAGFKQSQVVTVPDHLHFSIWAEDGYVIARDTATGSTFFIEPYEFLRYGDGLVADFVSNATSLATTQAPLYFQGGNVLIGDDFFFIGADYPANSLKYINTVILPNEGETKVDAVKRLYCHYMDRSRTLYYIGSTIPVPSQATRTITIDGQQWTEELYAGNRPGTVQPLFHIDMFLSLAGKGANGRYQVLVGDPRLGAKILKVPVWPHAMAEVFDNIAESLTRQGFEVVRNPLPMAYADDPQARERRWYFATANNALVWIDGAQKEVWLPSYGFGNWKSLVATDAENRRIWQTLGFTVHMLGDFHPFAENLGAVHCIKKYLARA